MEKQYRFDYVKEMVDKWADKTHVTRQMLNLLPWHLRLPYIDLETYIPFKDYYGEVVDNPEEWHRQHDKYLDKLWEELGSYRDSFFNIGSSYMQKNKKY